MPKRKSTTAATADTYDSDNGFVEDDDENGSRKKKVKSGNGAKKGGDGDGDLFWELTSKRRVGISEFKGKCMVNIREYYEKDGEVLPGKKGISLPVEQFNALVKVLPQIETALAGKGQRVERPDYGGAGASAAGGKEEEEDDEKEVEKKGKKNFEETSDDE